MPVKKRPAKRQVFTRRQFLASAVAMGLGATSAAKLWDNIAFLPRVDPLRKKKIAILGTTPSRMQAPINDKEWQIWTIGPGGSTAHRWDRLFEVHSAWNESFDQYMKELRAIKRPRQVITMAPLPDCPANVVYPKQRIIEKFGGRRMWYSSSISWCLALAIDERPTDIGLWGIDLESGEEYQSQFVGCAHFIDLARTHGINVHMPKDCGLLRDPTPYPERYETHFAVTTEKKAKWLDGMITKLENDYEQGKCDVYRKEGELLCMRRMGCGAKEIQEGEQQLLNINRGVGHLAANINQLKGERSATMFYRKMYVYGTQDPEVPNLTVA